MSCLNDYNLPTIINQLKCWCIQWRGQVQTIFPEGMTQIEQIQELFTAVKNTAEAQIEVMTKFCELYNFVNDFFENLDLQGEVNNWLEKALESGKLETIIASLIAPVSIGWISKEEDFEKWFDEGVEKLYLANDIEVSKPIEVSGKSLYLEGNNHKIVISDNFMGDSLFILGKGEGESGLSSFSKRLRNLTIDMNKKEIYTIDNYFWSGGLENVAIQNSRLGLVKYEGESNQGNVLFKTVTIYHDITDANANRIGLEARWNDSRFHEVVVVGFGVGIYITGSQQLWFACHPWGYPFVSYGINAITRVLWLIKGFGIRLIGCVADTCERVDTEVEPSQDNGGIYVAIQARDVYIDNMLFIIHASTRSSGYLIGNYYSGAEGGNGWVNNAYVCNCQTSDDFNNGVNKKIIKPVYTYKDTDLGLTLFNNSFTKDAFLVSVNNKATPISGNIIYKGTIYTDNSEFIKETGEFVLCASNGNTPMIGYKSGDNFIVGEFCNPFYYSVPSIEGLKSVAAEMKKYNWSSRNVIVLYLNQQEQTVTPTYYNPYDEKMHKVKDDSPLW